MPLIRPVQPAEHAAAGELVVAAYGTIGTGPSEGYAAQQRDVAGRSATSEVLVAELDGELAGCVTFVAGGPMSEIDDPEAASIRMLAVTPEHHGRGVGEALVRAGIDRARAAGRARLRLHTQRDMTAAQRLYERLGFARDPGSDFSPKPGVTLLGYVLAL